MAGSMLIWVSNNHCINMSNVLSVRFSEHVCADGKKAEFANLYPANPGPVITLYAEDAHELRKALEGMTDGNLVGPEFTINE